MFCGTLGSQVTPQKEIQQRFTQQMHYSIWTKITCWMKPCRYKGTCAMCSYQCAHVTFMLSASHAAPKHEKPYFYFLNAIGLLGETRRHGGSFLIKRCYSVLCHFLQSKSHFSVLDIKSVSLTQVPSYLHSFMCPGEPWSSYSSFVHCSWY